LEDNEKLLFIWDKFHEIIETGQINDIINGTDEIENPLPVWTFEDGKLIETHTDEYGWPNTTFDGYVMYENTHFPTKKEAIEKAIVECEIGVKWVSESIEELEEKIVKEKERLEKEKKHLEHFKTLIEE